MDNHYTQGNLFTSEEQAFADSYKKLSARARHILMNLRNSFEDEKKFISYFLQMPEEEIFFLKNCGKKTLSELLSLRKTLLYAQDKAPIENSLATEPSNGFLSRPSSEKKKEDSDSTMKQNTDRYHNTKLAQVDIPAQAWLGIRSLEASLGYFPLFAAVNAYLGTIEDREILDSLLIRQGQQPQDKKAVARTLGISAERVRQKRNELITRLGMYFASYRTYGIVGKCPYSYQMRRINEDINASEGTDFSLNFVNWVLASTFEDLTLLGDSFKALSGYFSQTPFICIVPTKLCGYMDFPAFIGQIKSILAEKRTDAVRLSLQGLIDANLKVKDCKSQMPEIETTCRTILYLYFPVEVNDTQVIFSPNAKKSSMAAIEDIIREAGHPLTLKEIQAEFKVLYPERNANLSALRANTGINRNILPISRSSTYTLLEWEEEGKWKGGTIRGIITEYLKQQSPTIAASSEVASYVRQFRPDTNEGKILTNLSLEKDDSFAFYYRNGVKYIGLSCNDYPLEFFPYSGDGRNVHAMSIYYPELESFIAANGRFPKASLEHEHRLYSFWARQNAYLMSGMLNNPSGLAYHIRILKKYLPLSKNRKLQSSLSDLVQTYNQDKESLPVWKRQLAQMLSQG